MTVRTIISVKIFGTKQINPVKVDKLKTFISTFAYFLTAITNVNY